MTWSIGAAKADITPPVGCVMGGYGARKGRAESIAAPLYCRAFVFDDGASKLALAVCDLVFVTYDISSRSRQLISDQLGIPASCVMVTGTHTHSGPAGLTVGLDPVFTESVSRKIAGAVGEAFRQRQPAWLKYAEVPVTTIGQNRRDPDGLIETTARLLIAEHADLARPLATIVNYALSRDRTRIRQSCPFPRFSWCGRRRAGTKRRRPSGLLARMCRQHQPGVDAARSR